MSKINANIFLNEKMLSPISQLKLPNYHIYRADNTVGLRGHACGSTSAIIHRKII
jgi:hypothetical protein